MKALRSVAYKRHCLFGRSSVGLFWRVINISSLIFSFINIFLGSLLLVLDRSKAVFPSRLTIIGTFSLNQAAVFAFVSLSVILTAKTTAALGTSGPRIGGSASFEFFSQKGTLSDKHVSRHALRHFSTIVLMKAVAMTSSSASEGVALKWSLTLVLKSRSVSGITFADWKFNWIGMFSFH